MPSTVQHLLLSSFCLVGLSSQETKSCYACASEGLSSRWQIAGLPRPQDSYFTDCSAQNVGKLQTESCTGSCFTYMFEDPDIHKTLYNHITLTWYLNDPSSRAIVWSSSQFPREFGGQVLSCYECTPQEGKNCKDKDRKCSSKKYCSKQTVFGGRGHQVAKSCSNINILGVDNSCVSYDVLTSPGGVTVRNKYSHCYCRDQQFCNEVSQPTIRLAFLITLPVIFL
uniref:Protein sleepless n=1 Tax=Angiostrongylus cantonensis TaxID=6313 RepID=A0A0K0D2Z6_ANGCA